jgi:hypothetical protein
MTSPEEPSIEHLTYTYHEYFRDRKDRFFLDQLLNRMPPPLVLDDAEVDKAKMGSLSRFPLEVIIAILEGLPIPDLMRFRRCSRAANLCVDTSSLLRSTLRLTPNVLKGIMAIQPSESINAHQLRSKLTQRSCDRCGKPAQHIYLPTYSRACLTCLPNPRNFVNVGPFGTPQCAYYLERVKHIDVHKLMDVPSFRFLPAVFSNGVDKFAIRSSHVLYDSIRARRLEKPHEERDHTETDEDSDSLVDWLDYVEDRDDFLPYPDPSRDEVTVLEYPAPEILRLHMCVVFVPWLVDASLSSELEEESLFCSNCLYTESQDEIYTKDSFREHLKDCRVRPHDHDSQLSRDKGDLFLVTEDEDDITAELK